MKRWPALRRDTHSKLGTPIGPEPQYAQHADLDVTMRFVESQTLPDIDYAGFAASLGLQAIAVDKPGDIAPAWERALDGTVPTLLDVRCDPNVPPIPPHATFEQMTDAAKALLAGDEDRWGVLKQGVKTKLQELLPHRNSP